MKNQELTLARFKSEANANHQAAYFVDALAYVIETVGGEDPCLADKAFNGYAMGGLAAGLRFIATDMMVRSDELVSLIENAELAPQNKTPANRGARGGDA